MDDESKKRRHEDEPNDTEIISVATDEGPEGGGGEDASSREKKRARFDDDLDLGIEDEEDFAREFERRKEKERKQAARQKASKFKQTFEENAEFGSLKYTQDNRDLGEEDAEGEASLVADSSEYKVQGEEIPVEPFNLNEERSMGYFDESGNFVFSRRSR